METFYTVDDIARMTMFTTRTIRNYLKDGLLTGRKIGSQWRFTQEDVSKFLNQGKVEDALVSEKRQEVLDFLDGVFPEYSDEVQICTVVDVYRPPEAVDGLKDELIKLPDSHSVTGAAQLCRFSYEYSKKEGRARFILFGSPDFIGEAIKIVKENDK